MLGLAKKYYLVTISLLLLLFFVADPLQVFPIKAPGQNTAQLYIEVNERFQAFEECYIELIEEGDNYNLTFEGLFINDQRINGQVKSFDPKIDIYRINGELYIKKNNDWVAAKELGLGGLAYFLKTPWEVLSLFEETDEKELLKEDETLVIKIMKHKNNAELLKDLFPHLPARSDLQLYLTLYLEENKNPYKILIEGINIDSGETIIRRLYNLEH